MTAAGVATTETTGRLPGLDGLRGIAILLVLVFHGFGFSARADEGSFDSAVSRVIGAGWSGVDLFFVLSGFLITGILLDGRDSTGSALSFYARRALRILPVYFGFLFFLIYLLPIFGSAGIDEGAALLRENQWWYWLFLLNFKIVLQPLVDLGELGNGHLWSLMVEEQFYLIWPVVVLLVPRRALLPVIVACIVAAPLFRYAVLEGAFPRINNAFTPYVLMPSRMDTLAFGALAAVVLREPSLWQRVRPLLLPVAIAAAAVLAVLAVHYDRLWVYDRWTQIAGFTCLAVVFGVLVAWVAGSGNRGLAKGALSLSVLAFFGQYSYGLYVFHHQIMYEASTRWETPVVAGTDLPGRLLFTLVTGACATALAYLSWHLYETKFLALKKYVPYGRRKAEPTAPPAPEVAAAVGE